MNNKNILPRSLETDVYTFIDIVNAKGDLPSQYEVATLIRAMENNSPTVDTRVNKLIASTFPRCVMKALLTDSEIEFIGSVVARLEEWHGPPRVATGRAKVYTLALHVMISTREKEALDAIQERTGEERTHIVRRAIREAADRVHASSGPQTNVRKIFTQ